MCIYPFLASFCVSNIIFSYCLFYFQGILDQFNPSLKNFVTMGKHYEKALTGQTLK